MRQEEGPLAPIEIFSSFEYKSGSKASTSSSSLPLYILFSLVSPPLSLSSLPISPLLQYNMSQYNTINYKQIIQ